MFAGLPTRRKVRRELRALKAEVLSSTPGEMSAVQRLPHLPQRSRAAPLTQHAWTTSTHLFLYPKKHDVIDLY